MSAHDFKIIPGLPGHSACLVTGQIRNDKTGKHLRQFLRKSSCRWYWYISVRGEFFRVNRLVAAASIGRRLATKEQAHHIDGNPHNNSAVNLRVGTALENARDKLLHGTNGRVLSNAAVREIRMLAGRVKPAILARQYCVTKGHIWAILAGRRWAGLA